jgi:hypothetical protein
MGSRFVVIALGVGVLATAGCYRHRYGYGYGYYGSYSYQPTVQTEGGPQAQGAPQGQPQGDPNQQPQPQGQGVQVTATATVTGEGITGSDGTRGWRVVVQAPQHEFQRLGQAAARLNCKVEGSNNNEFRAVCNPNVHILLRFDQQHVYKLCAPNTDANACATVWASFGN